MQKRTLGVILSTLLAACNYTEAKTVSETSKDHARLCSQNYGMESAYSVCMGNCQFVLNCDGKHYEPRNRAMKRRIDDFKRCSEFCNFEYRD